MHPQLHINYLAIFVFGWLWYGPIAGRKWAALMKLPAGFKPERKAMLRSLAERTRAGHQDAASAGIGGSE